MLVPFIPVLAVALVSPQGSMRLASGLCSGLAARPACRTAPLRCMAATNNDVQPGENLWDIVGCPPGSSREDIRRAYRRRARTLHPDVSSEADAPVQFRRLVAAFELLMDEQKRSSWESSRIRQNARERANRAWGADAPSASDRPAGSRREAEARTREESNKRRKRWREMLYSQIFREHMPLEFEGNEQLRAHFVSRMEHLVDEFATGGGNSPAGGTPRTPSANPRPLVTMRPRCLRGTQIQSCARSSFRWDEVPSRHSLPLVQGRRRRAGPTLKRRRRACWRQCACARCSRRRCRTHATAGGSERCCRGKVGAPRHTAYGRDARSSSICPATGSLRPTCVRTQPQAPRACPLAGGAARSGRETRRHVEGRGTCVAGRPNPGGPPYRAGVSGCGGLRGAAGCCGKLFDRGRGKHRGCAIARRGAPTIAT